MLADSAVPDEDHSPIGDLGEGELLRQAHPDHLGGAWIELALGRLDGLDQLALGRAREPALAGRALALQGDQPGADLAPSVQVDDPPPGCRIDELAEAAKVLVTGQARRHTSPELLVRILGPLGPKGSRSGAIRGPRCRAMRRSSAGSSLAREAAIRWSSVCIAQGNAGALENLPSARLG